MHLTSLPDRLSENALRNLSKAFSFSHHEHFIGQGMVHDTQLNGFFLAICYRAKTRADNQQIQQLCVNAAGCLLAVRSGLSLGRKSDLQMHRTPSAFGDYRVLFVSDTSRTVSYWWGKLCDDRGSRALFGLIFEYAHSCLWRRIRPSLWGRGLLPLFERRQVRQLHYEPVNQRSRYQLYSRCRRLAPPSSISEMATGTEARHTLLR